MTIDVDAIGRLIAVRSWRLTFPAELEALLEAETGEERCRRLIRHNYVGLAIYNAFLLGDWLLIHDIFAVSLCLHLLVMTPIMGLVNATLARRPSPGLRESLLGGGIVLTTMAILGLMLLSHSPLRSSEHISLVLVILFATMVQRIRFRYVVAACVLSLGLYVAALSIFAHHEPARMAVADAVFAGVVLFSLIGCYNLEAEQRVSYLFALRDRLRNEELETISRRDALTGLGNRRALDAALARRQVTEGKGGAAIAVLIFDIDLFKSYNDDNGHLAGDACLKRIAAVIGGDLRLDRDCVFRFGGEEFLVLIDDSTLEEARAIGERVRRAVEAAAIVRGAGRPDVMTVSIGVSAGVIHDERSLADMIAWADGALYAAKAAGRNRVSYRDGDATDTPPSRAAA